MLDVAERTEDDKAEATEEEKQEEEHRAKMRKKMLTMDEIKSQVSESVGSRKYQAWMQKQTTNDIKLHVPLKPAHKKTLITDEIRSQGSCVHSHRPYRCY